MFLITIYLDLTFNYAEADLARPFTESGTRYVIKELFLIFQFHRKNDFIKNNNIYAGRHFFVCIFENNNFVMSSRHHQWKYAEM